MFGIVGFDVINNANKTNAGTAFLPLIPWDERRDAAPQIAKTLFGKSFALPDGMALYFNPPPIRGLGTSGGFEVYVQNRSDDSIQVFAAQVNKLIEQLRKEPGLSQINSFFRANIPQFLVEINEEKAFDLQVSINDIYLTLQTMLGSFYVNDFNKSGKTFRVLLQAENNFREKPQDINQFYVRSATSAMVPLSSLATIKSILGPEQIERMNGFPGIKIMGDAAPGFSSGQAIALVEKIAAQTLSPGYDIMWSGQAFQEKRIGHDALLAFGFAIIMVFLILAAQYERWTLPLGVILAVPFAILGALFAVYMRNMANDIYFQIGLIVLIGLSAKNAILIIEVAHHKHMNGESVWDAAIGAARLRLRPIIMTSLAFVLGVFPLVFASGAGAAARQSMGTGVCMGMLFATFIATLFVPIFFKWLSRLNDRPT